MVEIEVLERLTTHISSLPGNRLCDQPRLTCARLPRRLYSPSITPSQSPKNLIWPGPCVPVVCLTPGRPRFGTLSLYPGNGRERCSMSALPCCRQSRFDPFADSSVTFRLLPRPGPKSGALRCTARALIEGSRWYVGLCAGIS
jgi:hypothetical protein